jgi:hypothetical protein
LLSGVIGPSAFFLATAAGLPGPGVIVAAIIISLATPITGSPHAPATVFFMNGVGEGPAAEAGVQLGLHEGAEVFFGSSLPDGTDLLLQHVPRILGGKPAAADYVEDVTQGDVGYSLFPRFRGSHRQLGRGEHPVQPILGHRGTGREHQAGKQNQVHNNLLEKSAGNGRMVMVTGFPASAYRRSFTWGSAVQMSLFRA